MKILCTACAEPIGPGFCEFTIGILVPRACDLCGKVGDQGKGEIHAVDEYTFDLARHLTPPPPAGPLSPSD